MSAAAEEDEQEISLSLQPETLGALKIVKEYFYNYFEINFVFYCSTCSQPSLFFSNAVPPPRKRHRAVAAAASPTPSAPDSEAAAAAATLSAAHAAPAPEASSSSGQSRPRAAGKAASSVAQQHPAPSAQHPPGQQRVIRGHGNQLERAQQRVMSQGVGQRRRVQHRAVRVCSAAHGGSQGAGSHEGTAGLGKASMSSPPRNPFSLPCTHPAPGFQS